MAWRSGIRIFVAVLVTGFFCLVSNISLADDISLPTPRMEGGMGLFDALKKRSSVSGGDILPAEVSLEDLSTILWAASGLNRGQTGWTVPMAEGLAPYVKIYVAGQDGIFSYDWTDNQLVEVSKENIKNKLGSHGFVSKAYYVLILTTDKEGIAKLEHSGEEVYDEFTNVLVGAMTQDIYLAAAALNLSARYIHTMNKEAIGEALGLEQNNHPIALMILAK
jgi:hypothetical protein